MLWSVLALVLSQAPDAPTTQVPEPAKPEGTTAMLVRQVKPIYPEEALRAGLEGSVAVACQVNAEGRVTDAKVVRGDQPLADEAVWAVRMWRYAPSPQGFVLTVMVNFVPSLGVQKLKANDLLSSLKSKYEAIRESAANHLGDLNLGQGDKKRAVKALRALLEKEESERVRGAATKALAELEQ